MSKSRQDSKLYFRHQASSCLFHSIAGIGSAWCTISGVISPCVKVLQQPTSSYIFRHLLLDYLIGSQLLLHHKQLVCKCLCHLVTFINCLRHAFLKWSNFQHSVIDCSSSCFEWRKIKELATHTLKWSIPADFSKIEVSDEEVVKKVKVSLRNSGQETSWR